jgi:hypothetical protein
VRSIVDCRAKGSLLWYEGLQVCSVAVAPERASGRLLAGCAGERCKTRTNLVVEVIVSSSTRSVAV